MFRVIEEKIAVPLIIILTLFVLGGIFYSVNLADKEFEEATEYAPIKSEKKDSTENWQTYRNEEFGFEVKHPQSLSLSETIVAEFAAGDWFRLNLDGDRVSVLVEVNADGYGPLFPDRNYEVDIVANSLTIVSTEDIEYKSTSGESPADDGIFFARVNSFEYNSLTYGIQYRSQVNENSEAELFEQILSTFKFIE